MTTTVWTPLLDVHRAMRARLDERDGAPVILDYGAPDAEYRAIRSGAGLLDLSARGRIRARGADHVGFLQRMVTNDVAGLAEGAGCHALFLTDRGRVQLDLWALRRGNDILLETEPALRARVVEALSAFVIMDDVAFDDVSAEWALLSLHGPRAREILRAARVEPTHAALDALYRHAAVDAETVHPIVVRRDRFGETGFDLWVPWRETETLYHELLRVGGPMGLAPVGESAAETLRIETGLARWGRELHAETLPLEAGLEDAIDYDKGCYVGQEYVSRATFVGRVQWLLACAEIDGADAPAAGALVSVPDDASRQVARVTSSALSPRTGRVVALLSVRRAHAAEGTVLRLADGRGVRVVPRPMVAAPGAIVPIAPAHPLARRD